MAALIDYNEGGMGNKFMSGRQKNNLENLLGLTLPLRWDKTLIQHMITRFQTIYPWCGQKNPNHNQLNRIR